MKCVFVCLLNIWSLMGLDAAIELEAADSSTVL